MSKIALLAGILLLCAIRLHNVASAADDDEFAEFDDPSLRDPSASVNQPPTTPSPRTDRIKSRDHIDKQAKQERSDKPESKSNDPKSAINSEGSSSKEESKSNKKPDLKLVNAPTPFVFQWEQYFVEFLFITTALAYVTHYFMGCASNKLLVQNWFLECRNLLMQQFSLVGGSPVLGNLQRKDDESDPAPASKKQRGLVKSSESHYTLWNSGRVGVDGLLIELDLLKRQDMFSQTLNLLRPKKDTMILRFALTQDYDNFVFCLAHKVHASKLTKEMIDINTFCAKRKLLNQCGIESEKLYVMSELSDVLPFILDSRTSAFIKKHEQSINYIHITDQYSTVRSEEASAAQKLAKPKRMAIFSFELKTSSEDNLEFITFALSLLDKLRKFRLARDSKQKSEKNRQKINDIIQKTAFAQKQEAAQARREELRRLEKEKIFSEDNVEKQRQWEKKEAKREQKKNKMRVKQLKIKSM